MCLCHWVTEFPGVHVQGAPPYEYESRQTTPPDVDMNSDYNHHEDDEPPVIPAAWPDRYHFRGEFDTPIKFYHRSQPYYDFTNFANYPVRYNGRSYPTAEHLFQAMKFMDHEPRLAEHIRRMPTPRAALQEATRMRSMQRNDWFEVNVDFMDTILEAKFKQHPTLIQTLLGTGNRALLEDSPVDSFWGTGADGRGQNELGKALMRLRDRLRVESDRSRGH